MPIIGTLWKHKSKGSTYEVIAVVNGWVKYKNRAAQVGEMSLEEWARVMVRL
jgi:hypothetical protein